MREPIPLPLEFFTRATQIQKGIILLNSEGFLNQPIDRDLYHDKTEEVR